MYFLLCIFILKRTRFPFLYVLVFILVHYYYYCYFSCIYFCFVYLFYLHFFFRSPQLFTVFNIFLP